MKSYRQLLLTANGQLRAILEEPHLNGVLPARLYTEEEQLAILETFDLLMATLKRARSEFSHSCE